MNITYQKAHKEDADLLIQIYNAAFYEDYRRYGECPAYGRDRKSMEISLQKFPKYIAFADGKGVGVISFAKQGPGQYFIGCLCVIPTYQGRGIGQQLLQYMQSLCDDWKTIDLITPADKEENIRFYTQKCGFQTGHKTMDGNVCVITLHLKRQYV